MTAPPMMAPPMMASPMMAPPMMAPPMMGAPIMDCLLECDSAPMMAPPMMAPPMMAPPMMGAPMMDCLLECDSAPPEKLKENVDGMKTVAEPGLNEIIDLQLANGSFKMDKVLEKLLSMDEQTLKTKCPSKTEFVVWITALCVVLIETKYSKEKDLWILVTTKGRKYLANASEDSDVLLNKAIDVVNFV